MSSSSFCTRYGTAPCSSSSHCSGCYIKLFLIGPNDPTLALLHTWGNPKVSGILAVGTCLEITALTVVIYTVSSTCIPLSFLPGDHDVLSSLQSDGSPIELKLSAHTPSCNHTLWVQWVFVSYALSLFPSLSLMHTQYALYKFFKLWPKSVKITGINYTPLLTHLTLLLKSITGLVDWKRPRPIADPWLTHLCINLESDCSHLHLLLARAIKKWLSKREFRIVVKGTFKTVDRQLWLLQDRSYDLFVPRKVFVNMRLPATF